MAFFFEHLDGFGLGDGLIGHDGSSLGQEGGFEDPVFHCFLNDELLLDGYCFGIYSCTLRFQLVDILSVDLA